MAQTNTKNSNYSILVDAELDLTKVKQQLKKVGKENKINFDNSSVKNASKQLEKLEEDLKDLKRPAEDLGLTFQQANSIMQKSIDIISSMKEQVFELDDAMVELRKVSDLNGRSLESYKDKLTDIGLEVARTGKPKCLSLNVGMVNQHYRTVQNPVKPKSLFNYNGYLRL